MSNFEPNFKNLSESPAPVPVTHHHTGTLYRMEINCNLDCCAKTCLNDAGCYQFVEDYQDICVMFAGPSSVCAREREGFTSGQITQIARDVPFRIVATNAYVQTGAKGAELWRCSNYSLSMTQVCNAAIDADTQCGSGEFVRSGSSYDCVCYGY